MINKIVASLIFACLIFAISLSLLGVDGPITLGPAFRSFMKTCSEDLENFKIDIPNIPKINYLTESSQVGGIDFLLDFINVFITIINGFVVVLNFIITIINVIIQLLEFIFIVLRNFIVMRDSFVQTNNA